MTRQWIRSCQLVVGDGGSAIDLSQMRIRFNVQKADVSHPGQATIVVTNLSKQTASKIQKEYTKVILKAGYQDGSDTIFEGEIVQKMIGRETPTDTYLKIIARESQQAFAFATIAKTLAKGHTLKDQVDECLKALKPYGVVSGYITDLGDAKMPRGRTLFGMVREQLRVITATVGASWSIQGNKLQILKNDELLPGQAIVLNSRTGMVGMPVQTMNGIEVRCLLNPKLKIGGRLQIDESSIQRQEITQNYAQQAQNSMIPEIDADGIYKILDFTHTGDTRGTEWYSDIICLAASGSIVPQSAMRLLQIPK